MIDKYCKIIGNNELINLDEFIEKKNLITDLSLIFNIQIITDCLPNSSEKYVTLLFKIEYIVFAFPRKLNLIFDKKIEVNITNI